MRIFNAVLDTKSNRKSQQNKHVHLFTSHTHTQSRMHLTHTQTAKTCAPSTLCFTLRDARALASLLHKSGQKAMDRISLALNLGVSARAMQRPAVPPSNRYHKKWSGPKARTHNWDHARHPPLINTRPTSKNTPPFQSNGSVVFSLRCQRRCAVSASEGARKPH